MPIVIGAAQSDGSVRSSDSRVGLVPNAAGDQLAGLQAGLDVVGNRAIGGSDRSFELGVGVFRKNGDLNYVPVTGHRSLTLRGKGSRDGQHAPTVILDTADAGDGAWGLQMSGPAQVYDISDISFQALGPSIVYGNPGWGMRGVLLNGRGSAKDLTITAYGSAVGVGGDHQNAHDLTLVGNGYAIDFFPGGTSQGDIVFRKVQGDGGSIACIGVAAGRVMAGCAFIDGSGGQQPYMLRRYPVVGAPNVSGSWMTGVMFERWATEFCGNGVVYDEVQDGAGISDIDWIGNSVDWGLFNPAREWVYNGETKPKVAAWFNGGDISDFRIHEGFPGLTNGLPSFKASNIVDLVAPNSGRHVLPALVAGERAFEVTSNSGFLQGTSIGRPGDVFIKPYKLATGTIARGELLTNNNEHDARKYAGTNTEGNRRVIGVATQACDSAVQATRVVCALKTGNTSDTVFKNTSGITIAPNKLLKPAATGSGVAEAASMTDGQVIGRSTAQGLDGALFAAEMFGML